MFLTPSAEALTTEILRQIGVPLPPSLGVAVSGGSDSLALMYLLADLVAGTETQLHVATVDHGLRAESRGEAEAVATHAAGLGLSHDILTWQNPADQGNLQGAARAARYRLLGDWAKSRGIAQVAVGHTADDQAETVLMRLRRASGVTGLSGMPVRHHRDGVEILRPMLGLRRRDLRDFLLSRDISWSDDPSNQDRRFERVRIRDAFRALEPLGVTAEALAAVAENMRMAEAALSQATQAAATDIACLRYGAVMIDAAGFEQLPEDLARRLVVRALAYVSGAVYPPRRMALQDAMRAMQAGRSTTIQGCRILRRGSGFWVCRELQAVRDLRRVFPASGQAEVIWDETWRIHATRQAREGAAAIEIRPVGEDGIRQLTDWRQYGVPREVILPLPGVWSGDELRSVPVLQATSDWSVAAIRSPATWASGTLSH
ncbi:tRNA lysidine(34) synthetase TilS [Phaeobacter sp. B1627]|uniref:tRNA lysidine(34) synthetase TilS n=1 Tax=Phaeobacter sp. B1627 TaxID=2583809 RepID=UPI001119689B|nr:tRNA lysidine(34) synthetase TilS [Phaeobacter sp. B1627]TNJ42028.1 tRNA lysidine(34) synthetase TilS [Phaeobacter sp. B1627]